MTFLAGQGVLGKITFKDGKEPLYDRTYLVVDVTDNYIEVLNVSSTKGKEYKLLFPYNEELKVYKPPFLKPSFVKLDSLVRVSKEDWRHLRILCNGACLDSTELARIKGLIPS